ncbi:MAG: hypothetical protein KC621_09680, partial [Myxococcales bacterium]|nr:hypothetical protein [Myxococcales bacterium]
MSESTLQKLVGLARRAVRDLGGEATDAQLELWATDVHESMSAGGRSFHDVGHVFDVAEGGNAVQVLAALFHDTVYMQVDGGLPSRLVDVLGDAFHVGPDGVALVIGDDPWKARLAQIFGFVDGQVLSPFAGLNELLSALFAVRRLHDVLPVDATVRVAVCIEATIPFRSAPGEGVSDALLARVEGLGLALDAVQAVKDAVGLANQDVANFAFADTARFLDNTWQLLPESNTQLRVRVYTIDQYHLAMKKMRGFFGFLKAEVVFRGFRGAPSPARLDALRAAAARNIELAHHYLTAKLLAASLLQAIA